MQPQQQAAQSASSKTDSQVPPPNETDARLPPPRGAAAAPGTNPGYYGRYYPTAAAMPQLTYMEGQLTTQAMLVEQQRRIKQLEADLFATRAEVQRLQADARARESLNGTGNDASNNNTEKKPSSRYWTPDEHKRFLEGLELFGPRDIKSIARHVGTRSATQVRTHSQKYYIRLERERAKAEAAAAAAAAAANGTAPPNSNSSPNNNAKNANSPTSPRKSRARPRSRTTVATPNTNANGVPNKSANANGKSAGTADKTTLNDNANNANAANGAGTAVVSAVSASAMVKKETAVESPSKVADRRKRQQPDPDIGSTKRRMSTRRVKPKNEDKPEDNLTSVDAGAVAADDDSIAPVPNGAVPFQNSGETLKAEMAKNETLPDANAGGLLCAVQQPPSAPSGIDGMPTDSVQQRMPNVSSSVALGTLPNVPSSMALGSLPNVPSSMALGSLSVLPNVPSSGNLLAAASLPLPASLPLVSSSGQLSSLARVPSMGTLPRVSSSTGLPMVPSTGALPRVGSSGGLVLPRVASSLTAAWNAQTAMDRAAVAKLKPKDEQNGSSGGGGGGGTGGGGGGAGSSGGTQVATGTPRNGGGGGGGGGVGFPRTNSILSLLSGLPTNGMASVASSDRLTSMPFDTMDMDESTLEAKWAAES